ncbi:M3 family metallopeptidase [Jatrophihabitans sp. YIM 134969]
MTRAPLDLPVSDWTGWLSAQVEERLAAVAAGLDEIRSGAVTGADVLLRWNDADTALRDAASLASLLSEVHPDAEVRTLAEDLAQRIDAVSTDRDLDPALFAAIEALDGDAVSAAGDDADRFHDHVLRDFRRAGVASPEADRVRLKEISQRLTVVDQDFSRRIREDVRSVRLRPEQLDGLPADYVEAHPPGDDGLVTITTDYPDYLPFRTFATDADARRELALAFLNRAYPDNEPSLHEMFDLRAEQAALLGFDSWPDLDAAVKMIGSGDAIGAFIERLADAAGPAAARDREVLVARMQQDLPAATGLDSSQLGYYEELVRREQYDVDAQQVRRYFDFPAVRKGLLDVTGRLFGVEYREVDAPSWHEDVVVHDVVRDGVVIGRIRLDLHPRDGKYKHAAQFDLAVGLTDRQLPEGVLVCNFPRGLMEHDDVVTLFHEFGHLLHHVLGGAQRWARFSGVATEWDFVEAPSQMLEEWAWDVSVLQTFAADADGTPIPADLVERMRAADEFGNGIFVRTQTFYAAVSYLLHRDRPADLSAEVERLQRRYSPVDPLPGTHFEASFGHLGGYSSGYYTYMWSLVIAKDMFSRFDPADLLAPGVAGEYRDRVLVPGGSRDAADLVHAFLGREFGFDAFAAWLSGPSA